MRVRVLLLLGVMAGAAFAQAPRPPQDVRRGIACVFDGGDSAIQAGSKFDICIPFTSLFVEATMVADRSGSIEVEVRKCSFSQYDAGVTHPVTADKINGSNPLVISSGTKYTDTTLTGWSPSFVAGDVFEFYVNSATTIRRVTIILRTPR